MMEKKELKITCLNFEWYNNKKHKSKEILKDYILKFIKDEEVDIIAGQEIPKDISKWINDLKELENKPTIEKRVKGGHCFFTGFCIKNDEYKSELNSYAEMEEVWEDLFDVCTKEQSHKYRSAYFAEKWIKFCGENIRLINVHVTLRYEIQLRVSLLKYLSRLQNKYTIVMGDFNAAKNEQTENPIVGNHNFIKKIESKGYFELLGENETEEKSHYTYYHFKKKDSKVQYIGKKLDHIFVSNAFKETFKTSIEYDDEVNYRFKEYNEEKIDNAFTDHSAIRLTIEKKDKID